jgi:hypothetical protein
MNAGRKLTGILAAAVTASGILVAGSPAYAAAGCSETRAGANDLAASGQFSEPATVSLGRQNVTLRYSAGARCAWGLLTGLAPGLDIRGDVWLDRSRDAGATWEKSAVRKAAWNNSSTYTTAWSTDGHNAVRACGQVITQEFKKPKTRTNPQGVVDVPAVSDIHCTGWVSV